MDESTKGLLLVHADTRARMVDEALPYSGRADEIADHGDSVRTDPSTTTPIRDSTKNVAAATP